ncbi:hypothetical protein BCR42DRAFT_439482 [Absidia repens]|uniref:Uncharacterized protein n=1 Tax=Absidia repens TaxID=90262 RepID=A0A1X2IAT4_9FUNG|nr:hypothetical protein BCR42DRAFT_439482 [Absidia repens]
MDVSLMCIQFRTIHHSAFTLSVSAQIQTVIIFHLRTLSPDILCQIGGNIMRVGQGILQLNGKFNIICWLAQKLWYGIAHPQANKINVKISANNETRCIKTIVEHCEKLAKKKKGTAKAAEQGLKISNLNNGFYAENCDFGDAIRWSTCTYLEFASHE